MSVKVTAWTVDGHPTKDGAPHTVNVSVTTTESGAKVVVLEPGVGGIYAGNPDQIKDLIKALKQAVKATGAVATRGKAQAAAAAAPIDV